MSTTGYSASPYRKPQKLSDRVLGKSERSPCRKLQKLSDRLLWKSECVSVRAASRREAHRRYCLAENLKNKAIAVVEE
ncbi:hypothetical protein [Nostoc commune]|uniref:hypothetical protein n=1 Tax=Nostoc commune TaxID=1178 RepID=UPI0020745F38|nr:hypothetical protein [Nostoc commune]